MPLFTDTRFKNLEIVNGGIFYMKATGIVRRIDDLGRIVIPKEIRRVLRIRESDPIEIFTDKDGQVILQKYSPLGDLMEVAENFADALASVSGHMVLIADRDVYIAAAGGAKAYLGKPIGKAAEDKIHARETLITSEGERNFVNVCEEVQEDIRHEALMPIICQGDIVGGVVFLEKDPKKRMTEADTKLLQAAVSFLGKQIEH